MEATIDMTEKLNLPLSKRMRLEGEPGEGKQKGAFPRSTLGFDMIRRDLKSDFDECKKTTVFNKNKSGEGLDCTVADKWRLTQSQTKLKTLD